jgi:hypothetical protein
MNRHTYHPAGQHTCQFRLSNGMLYFYFDLRHYKILLKISLRKE